MSGYAQSLPGYDNNYWGYGDYLPSASTVLPAIGGGIGGAVFGPYGAAVGSGLGGAAAGYYYGDQKTPYKSAAKGFVTGILPYAGSGIGGYVGGTAGKYLGSAAAGGLNGWLNSKGDAPMRDAAYGAGAGLLGQAWNDYFNGGGGDNNDFPNIGRPAYPQPPIRDFRRGRGNGGGGGGGRQLPIFPQVPTHRPTMLPQVPTHRPINLPVAPTGIPGQPNRVAVGSTGY